MNNKQLLFIVILFWLPFLSFAQEYYYVPFPDSGAVWSEMYNPSMGSNELLCYERFSLTGEDTLINDISYKKLYIFYTKVFDKSNARCVGGIREDDQKRVYYNGEGIHSLKPSGYDTSFTNSGILLYDFSANIGDTIKNGNISLWDPFLLVEDIDTIQIGNSLRKVYQMNIPWVQWIEGIGNTRGLLFTSGDVPTNGTWGNLICFIQNDEVIYHSDIEYYTDCFPSSVGISNMKLMDFNLIVCPNPVTGNSIRFEWNDNTIRSLELFNLKGAFIENINVVGQNQLEYATNFLQPGLYFYRATSSGGSVQTGKFEVQ